jgi:hypothetical protein
MKLDIWDKYFIVFAVLWFTFLIVGAYWLEVKHVVWRRRYRKQLERPLRKIVVVVVDWQNRPAKSGGGGRYHS